MLRVALVCVVAVTLLAGSANSAIMSPEIVIANANGSHSTDATQPPDYSGEPSLSPDGTTMALVRQSGNSASILLTDLHGSATHTLVGPTLPDGSFIVPPYAGEPTTITWSPNGRRLAFDAACLLVTDGRRIAFAAYHHDWSAIMVTQLHPLETREAIIDSLAFPLSRPLWTHDGRSVIYVALR